MWKKCLFVLLDIMFVGNSEQMVTDWKVEKSQSMQRENCRKILRATSRQHCVCVSNETVNVFTREFFIGIFSKTTKSAVERIDWVWLVNRVFPILCYISWIRWIKLIQLESFEQDWRLLKAFLCLSLTVDTLVYWLASLTGDQEVPGSSLTKVFFIIANFLLSN